MSPSLLPRHDAYDGPSAGKGRKLGLMSLPSVALGLGFAGLLEASWTYKANASQARILMFRTKPFRQTRPTFCSCKLVSRLFAKGLFS